MSEIPGPPPPPCPGILWVQLGHRITLPQEASLATVAAALPIRKQSWTAPFFSSQTPQPAGNLDPISWSARSQDTQFSITSQPMTSAWCRGSAGGGRGGSNSPLSPNSGKAPGKPPPSTPCRRGLDLAEGPVQRAIPWGIRA